MRMFTQVYAGFRLFLFPFTLIYNGGQKKDDSNGPTPRQDGPPDLDNAFEHPTLQGGPEQWKPHASLDLSYLELYKVPYTFHFVFWFAINLLSFVIKMRLQDLDQEMSDAMKSRGFKQKMNAVSAKALNILLPELFLAFCEWLSNYFMGLFQATSRKILTEFSLRVFLSQKLFIQLNQRPIVPLIDIKISEDIATYCDAFPRVLYFTITWPINMFLYAYRLVQRLSFDALFLQLFHFVIFQGISLAVQHFIHHYHEQYYLTRPDYLAIHDIYMKNMDEIEMSNGKSIILEKMNSSLSKMTKALQKLQFLKSFYAFVNYFYKKSCNLLNHWLVIKYAIPGALNYYELLKYVNDFSKALSQFPDILNHYGRYSAAVQLILSMFDSFKEMQVHLLKQKYSDYPENDPGFFEGEALSSSSGTCGSSPAEVILEFRNVTLAAPSFNATIPSKIIFENINFSLPQKKNLLIMGPSGIGKTSLYRALFGLWPPYKGEIHFPLNSGTTKSRRRCQYMKLPSQSLLPPCNLTEQLLFPTLYAEYRGSKAILELKVQRTLKKLGLKHLSHRFHSHSDVTFEEWDSLSSGEKQRIGFARLFLAQYLSQFYYHAKAASIPPPPRPSQRRRTAFSSNSGVSYKLAFLDESSFSIDPLMEVNIYEQCKKYQIQLITIEHRRNVMPYYDYLLEFKADRSFTFSDLSPSRESKELALLEVEKKELSVGSLPPCLYMCLGSLALFYL